MSLSRALADLAAGRPVSAADYARLEALCRRADEEALPREASPEEESAETGAEAAPGRSRACRRCGTLTRHVYCPTCGERVPS